MKLSILHLSDLHLREGGNAVSGKAAEIAAALQSADPLVKDCIVIITGDLAFSGKAPEYNQAVDFLNELRQQLDGTNRPRCVGICCVPGNHDCDFGKDTDVRRLVLHAFTSGQRDLSDGDDLVKSLLTVQGDFFYVESLYAARKAAPGDPQGWVTLSTEMHVGDQRVVVNAFNTAITSQLPESQGQLRFPLNLVRPSLTPAGERDLLISIFHHPYNWLEAENARAFKKHIETTSDLVLTGHEHEEDAYLTERLTGEEVEYLEGEALQHGGGELGGFNVVTWDFDQNKHKISQFAWAETHFALKNTSEWLEPVRNRAARRRSFEVNPRYLQELNDPGTGFTHPRKPDLTLEDLFIYPALGTESLKRLTRLPKGPKTIDSHKVLGYVASKEKVLILGADKSGKTAMAHMLFLDLKRKHGLVPVFLSGTQLKSANERTIIDLIYATFKNQYHPDQLELYTQLEPSKRALIVDDWDKTRLNWRGQAAALRVAGTFFGKIVVFAGDVVRALALAARESDPFKDFDDAEIRQFGNFLRGKLIDRWEDLGREYTGDEGAVVHDIHGAENLIVAVLGKNLLPMYPLMILSVLQIAEAAKTADPHAGSYGALLEALIFKALGRVSTGFPDFQTKIVFVSHLAFHLFATRRQNLTKAEVQVLAEGYFMEYSIRLEARSILGDLEDAHILVESGGNYRFSYSYYYYYFVARYMADNLRDKKSEVYIRSALGDMVDKVHSEEYSRILLFVVYRTQDSDLIQHILRNARRIYEGHTPCDFESDVEFVNRLYKEAPKMLLPATDVRENIEESRRRLDAAEEVATDVVPIAQGDPVEYSDGLGDIIKVNIALKTLEIMGQMLRNFAGSLRKEEKIEIARTSYQLGLRTLNAILRIGEANLEELRRFVAVLISEYRSFEERELEERADLGVVYLTRRIAFNFLKRISYSVGHPILEQTYKDVLREEGDRTPIRLVDLSIKLDHFTVFPEEDVMEMSNRLKRKNFFSTGVLADMVANHLYLFYVDERTRQAVGKELHIETHLPRMMESGQKRLPRRHKTR
jgi:predicted MPP superfamily phosphohydrolase